MELLLLDINYYIYPVMENRQKNIFFPIFRNISLNKGIGNFFFRSNYDLYGNMVKDQNKDINLIIYNHLNLPTEIQFTENRTIKYQYDATGIKRKKVVFDGTYTTVTDYLEGYQYENKHADFSEGFNESRLLFFPTAQGYVKPIYSQDLSVKTPKWQYVYNHTDHLGNIRVSYSKVEGQLKVLEETNYYPFGLKHSSYNQTRSKITRKVSNDQKQITPTDVNGYKYKYQGQERQDEFDLNWDSFKWRNYDYAIGRFMSVDPLTEDYMDWGPYVFSGNRVIDARELEGLEPFFINEEMVPASSNSSSSYLDGWNSSVGEFNSNLTDGLYSLMNDPIGTVSDAVSSTAESVLTTVGQVVSDVTGMSEVMGIENKTAGVLNQLGSEIQNIPNMTKEDVGNMAGQTVTTTLSLLITRKVPGSKTPSLSKQAKNIKSSLNNGKNSVTIKTPNGHTRYDLDGKAHGGIATPHKQSYKNNVVNGQVKSVSRTSKHAEKMTQQDVRTVRKTLEKREN